jgi:transposase
MRLDAAVKNSDKSFIMEERTNSTYELRSRAVEAIQRGRSLSGIADASGTNRSTLYRWVKRFEEEGEDGLQRRPTSGRPRKLEELTEEELRAIVLQPASHFGYESDLWTVVRLHVVIEEQYRVSGSKDTVWRRLREAGLTYQKPEGEYYELDEESRQQWLRMDVPKIRKTAEKYKAILYFQDEANVSLTAFLGNNWAPRGQTPKAKVTGKRGSVAAMSAMSRQGHLLFRLHQKRIASPEVIDFLKQMLTHHSDRHLVVVMDQAPPHTSKKTKT